MERVGELQVPSFDELEDHLAGAGEFGPSSADDPGKTSLTGKFSFLDAWPCSKGISVSAQPITLGVVLAGVGKADRCNNRFVAGSAKWG